MTIRFKCQHCQKPLSVKDHLAGKKAACPACKKAITIPAPVSLPDDVEAYAAEALADQPVEKPPEPVSTKTIEFTCPFCDEELTLPVALAGKKSPCPKCTNIIKVPLPKDDKPKDWRTVQKAGPSLAKGSVPEEAADAWSSAQKTKVSQAAMQEAGALPEVAVAPLGVGGWVRRLFWPALALGVVAALLTMGIRARDVKRLKDALKEAEKFYAQMEPLQQAEFHRVAGVIEVRKLNAGLARDHFAKSLATASSSRDEPASNRERDLFLIKLLLSQVEMGGTGDETLKSSKSIPRYDWKDGDVQKEMGRTLQALRSNESKATALRVLTSTLLDKDQAEVAFSMITSLVTDERSPLLAELVALRLARREDSEAEKHLPKPDMKFTTDTRGRIAYAAGFARRREFEEALNIAKVPGPAPGRLEACVAGAAIAFLDAKSKGPAAAALPFIMEGLKIYETELAKDVKDKPPSWAVLELISLGGRTTALDAVKKLVEKLPPAFRPCVEFQFFEVQLARQIAPETTVPDAIDPKSLMRGFAWEAAARHNARLGQSGIIPLTPAEDEPLRLAFLHLGLALGEHDPKK